MRRFRAVCERCWASPCIDDARANFEAALEISPEHLPAIQGAALIAVRSGRVGLRLAEWLDAIELRSGED